MKAVVFVDCQKDFLRGGVLPFGWPVEDNFQKVVDFAKETVMASNSRIYATRDTHEKTVFKDAGTVVKFDEYGRVADTEKLDGKPQSGYFATLEGQKLPVEHCVEGSDGWMVDERLFDAFDGKATFVNKPTFGSFDLADLVAEDAHLAGESVDEIILVGYDLSICVISNALLLRAKFPNAKIVIKKDLCGCVTEETFNAALSVAKCCQIDVE